MNTQNLLSSRRSRVKVASAFLISLLAALLIWPALVEGQIRSGAAFLQVIPGARQQGIAGSLTGAIDDLYAVYANPGAAGFLREWQWSATYTKWFADIYSASLFYGHRVRMPWSSQTRFGLSVAYQGMPDFNSTRQTNIAAVSASDLLAAASIGQPFQLWGKKLALGANIKYFRSELAQYDATAWVFDTGLLYRSSRFRFLNRGKGLFDYGIISAGVAMTQLGQSQTFISQGTPLPRTFRAGVAFNTGTHTGLQLQLSTDYKKIRDEKGAFSLGTELMWNQLLALRGGYDFSDRLLSHLAFGLSLRLDDVRSPITSVIPGRNNALRLDLAAMEDSQLFDRTYRGSVTHHPIGPEGFQFMDPPFDAVLQSDSVRIAWEATKDPDLYDDVTYWLVVDQDSAKIANTINSAKQSTSTLFQTLESTPFFISQRLNGTDFPLHDLQGGEYFAAVLAYDQDRHLRFADSDQNNMQRFRVAYPDIEITGITFDYSPWITEDDYQGRLRIAVKNSGQRMARDISLALYDSAAVTPASTSSGTAKSLAQTAIPELAAGAVDTVKLEWRTAQSGLHHLIARVDVENRVREMNEKNNQRRAAFYTIPKGRFATDDTVAIFTLSRLAYEVPFIAEVYFDRNSSVVQPEYFHQRIPGPQLKILAQRLKAHRDLKISLQGFVDPNSGERETALAEARAAAVRDSLINLGVNAEQISFIPGEVLPMRRTPANPEDARWVSEERRFVKITTDRGGEDKLFELIAFDATDSLPAPVVFGSTIKGAVPFKAGVMNIEAGKAQEKINPLHGTNLPSRLDWQPNPMNSAKLVEQDMSYTLALTDSLDRQFRTRPRQAYLIAPAVLREQRVAWPMQFARTDPLYDFYWDKLLVHINRLLADPDMRMRFSGHACAIGPDAINQRLSEQRAKAFRENFLLHLKTKYPQMHGKILLRLDQAVGYGEKRPLRLERLNGSLLMMGDNQEPLGRKLNRRLEIEFYYPQPRMTSLK